MPKKLFICAGEISGDNHGAALVRAIREIEPDIDFVGIGGNRMQAAGVRLIYNSTDWGTVGFFEGISRFPRLYPVLLKMRRIFSREAPALFVPIDYRFFNLKLCRIAHSMGIPIVYFFAPVSWFGSGKKRFEELAKYVNLSLLCLPLSFKEYDEAGAQWEYTGHPLVDTVAPTMEREESLRFFGLDTGKITIGLMPGSRTHEIRRLLPIFCRAVERLVRDIPGSQFILLSADAALTPLIRRIVRDRPVTIAESHTYDFMNISDLLVVCSGTATHEATLMEKPMIVAYRVSALTAALARSTMDITFIGLPNILANECVVPELVQEKCTPEAIVAEAHRLLADTEERLRMKKKLQEVKVSLGSPGVLHRAAEYIVDAVHGKWHNHKKRL